MIDKITLFPHCENLNSEGQDTGQEAKYTYICPAQYYYRVSCYLQEYGDIQQISMIYGTSL